MLWPRQAIFYSKGDKLYSSVECRILTQGSGTVSPAERMPADKPTGLSRIKLKNLNSIAHPYDQRTFIPLDPTAGWLSHLALVICMFVVINFDALAQASDFRIERRDKLCKKDVTPFLIHWSYIFLALNHWYHGDICIALQVYILNISKWTMP